MPIGRAIRKVKRVVSPPPRLFEIDPQRDVFLVSYPRSGNTWLRTVIACLQLQRDVQSIRELDFIVPDIYFSVPLQNMEVLPFYVVKSHEPYVVGERPESYRKVLYIVRDPRDVALSYHRYLCHREKYSGDIETFTNDFLSGRIWPCSWQDHVNSWTHWPESIKGQVQVLKYEDILARPTEHVGLISDFLGLERTSEWISEVAARTSAVEMRKRERAGKRKKIETGEMYFVGDASAGGWRGKMPDRLADLFQQEAGHVMSRYGYE